MFYTVFVAKAKKINDQKNNELVEKLINISEQFSVKEFNSQNEANKFVYQQETKLNNELPLSSFCAYYVDRSNKRYKFNLYCPEDDHFYTLNDETSIYCETNKKSYDAIIKIMIFLLSRYSNGFFSHEGEQFDYFVECMVSYHPDDLKVYLDILNDLKKDYNLKKFGLKK